MNIMTAFRGRAQWPKRKEKDVCEMDYIIHEYYRQTGKIAYDRLDSWIEAVRYIKGLGKYGKKNGAI